MMHQRGRFRKGLGSGKGSAEPVSDKHVTVH